MNTFARWWYFLHYSPKDRNYAPGGEWLEDMRAKLRKEDTRDVAPLFGLNGGQTASFPLPLLRHILETAIYLAPNPHFSKEDLQELYFDGDFRSDDSIHMPAVRKLIEQGIARMQTSNDPAHELSHIIRASRFAKILYSTLRESPPRLDWGIIATAIVWHDVSRTHNVGTLYNKNTFIRRLLRHISILQTLFIYLVWKHDAEYSCLEFLKESRGELPHYLRYRISFAILEDRCIPRLAAHRVPQDTLYQNIILSADALDMATIARGEAMYRNIAIKKTGDLRYVNRLIILNMLFKIKHIPRYLHTVPARGIYDIVQTTSYRYISQFYPTDAKVLEHALAKA